MKLGPDYARSLAIATCILALAIGLGNLLIADAIAFHALPQAGQYAGRAGILFVIGILVLVFPLVTTILSFSIAWELFRTLRVGSLESNAAPLFTAKAMMMIGRLLLVWEHWNTGHTGYGRNDHQPVLFSSLGRFG